MALNPRHIRLVALGVGMLAVGAIIGQVYRSSKAKPTSGPDAASSATIFDPSAADGGSPQIYPVKPDPHLTGIQLRPMDQEIFAAIASGQLEAAHLDDVFPSKPYRVKMIGSMVPRKWISVVLVDLTRDGKWDERWDLSQTDVVRAIFKKPRTDELGVDDTDPKFSLRTGTWQGF
jgi:hypothetical protein